jgi:DUF1680 family protein
MLITPLSLRDVDIQGGFWGHYQTLVHQATLPAVHEQLEQRGTMDALKLNWQPGMPNKPHIYWESDLAKWLEAASYVLAKQPDAALEQQVDEAIALLAGAQQPDGYLNAYYTVVEPGKRWTNLRDQHELYCAGHLIEAAVAHHEATGKDSLLKVMLRYADLIDHHFGPGDQQMHGYPGHEEIELALIRLHRLTGDERYFKLSQYFIEQRGQQPHYYDQEAWARGEDPANFRHGTYEYNQSHQPIREHQQAVGHAVRATYLYAAATDLAAATGDETLVAALRRVADNLIQRRMYITGGIGSMRANEGFTIDYDLPNDTGYAETCAAIGLFFWMHRMLHLEGDGRYADIMERALYNGILSGISLDGRSFFYENLLAVKRGTERTRFTPYHRQSWFSVSCCPPNVSRLFASLNQYLYAQGAAEIVVHHYVSSRARFQIAEQTVELTQQTQYPWDGEINLILTLAQPTAFTLRLRVPGWCRAYAVMVNGAAVEVDTEWGYVAIRRMWQAGDAVNLHLEMPIERVYAHPEVRANKGRVALQRGPVVYCLESADNGRDLDAIVLPRNSSLEAHFIDDLLGGVVVIEGDALREERPLEAGSEELYVFTPPVRHPCRLRAIPYYAWDNRVSGDLLVWLREIGE